MDQAHYTASDDGGREVRFAASSTSLKLGDTVRLPGISKEVRKAMGWPLQGPVELRVVSVI